MGSKSNTWCKKLTTKGKAYALKKALGNEKGVMSYCARVKNVQARDMDRQSMEDKPLPNRPKVTDKTPLPMAAGWKPAPYTSGKLRKIQAKAMARWGV